MKPIKSFTDYFNQCIGVRFELLLYVVCQNTPVDPVYPLLRTNQHYSDKYGLTKEDIIACALHINGLFKTNNAAVNCKLGDATRKNAYATSIVPFQREKND